MKRRQSRPRASRQADKFYNGTAFTCLALLGLLMAVPSATASGIDKMAEYCLGTHSSRSLVGEECFPLRPIPDGQDDMATDTSNLGEVCLEVMESTASDGDGETMLEVTFRTANDWVMKDTHFWLGSSVNAAPKMIMYLHDNDHDADNNHDGPPVPPSASRNGSNNGSEDEHDAATTTTYKMPDPRRFPYYTTMENEDDPRLHTTTEWNEVLEATPEIVCPAANNDVQDDTGSRAFSAQAVLVRSDGSSSRPIIAFAAMNEEEDFRSLESFFVVCACPADTGSGATAESETTEEENEEETKQDEVNANNMLAQMHAEEELEDEALESAQKQEETADKGGDEKEETVEEEIEEETKQDEVNANDMLAQMHAEDELNELLEHEEEEKGISNKDANGNGNQDYVEVQEGHLDRHSDSQEEEEEEEDSLEDKIAFYDDDHDENKEPVIVYADELELTTSFIVVVPDQKHYNDVLLDEDNLHATESKIEASPGLHQAWHTFVGQLMGDFNVPSINRTDMMGDRPFASEKDRRARGGHDLHRSLKSVTIEWIEDSPDLFRFLITTPCPTSVLNMLGDKKKHNKHVDMGSSPKALIRAGNNDQDSIVEATCYKAFGKYKVLHLMDPVDQMDEDLLDAMEDAGSSRQEVCYDIFHMTRQALSKDKLGQDLPDDVPFLIHGGKPESCLPTGFSTKVVKPDGLGGIDLSSGDSSDEVRKEKSPLYELHNEDGSWNILRVMELVAYLSTSILMMSVCITIYCYFLPKIDLESRNRVTDDWSHPSLRPQPIVGSRKGRGSSKNPDYFPWLE